MKLGFFSILLFFFITCWGQEDFLAKQYFNDGDFEKAVVFYKSLTDKNPRRSDYAEGLVACYQQLEKYKEAEEFLLKRLHQGSPYPTVFIELGYNYQLQKENEKASQYYEKALSRIEENPNYGYGIGFKFQRLILLDYALRAYERAMELNPKLDYNFQMARIYGEQGNVEKMYESYLELIKKGKASQTNVLRNLDNFISEDPNDPNNISLKRTLLLKAQNNPDILWNEVLSWLFVKQKQYLSAFNQEKAIYKRSEGRSLNRISGLGDMAFDNDALEDAAIIYTYIDKNSADPVAKLNANLSLIDIELLDETSRNLDKINKEFELLIEEYGYENQTLQLQIAYANFLTFKRNEAEKAIEILKQCLSLPLDRFSVAYVKLALGDILVFNQRFNEALIYFSQIQRSLKNDILGQNARFKVAQTSFYKGDFEWALTQLKVLRSSTSQLIANDAMQLSLLISDNSLEDSTQTALKKYAKADLLAYQQNTKEAIEVLNDILENHKGEKIEDEALMKQGELFEGIKDYTAAEMNYLKVVTFYENDILADDAHFALAELYRTVLNQPNKAKEHYEKIIYNFQDSYYFPEARKKFRILRGDILN
ncbi:tetratricopeptide repeat protein [Eudoraea chungangensis]|uniref:tetratricopeptide repeat protein n=1 Tax=Eudoraea chungangensis TaxID=1481905 RepID=UPI0023ED56F6|nr:tetratricopeptide repeat protein [Eudoraea chungangensis]